MRARRAARESGPISLGCICGPVIDVRLATRGTSGSGHESIVVGNARLAPIRVAAGSGSDPPLPSRRERKKRLQPRPQPFSPVLRSASPTADAASVRHADAEETDQTVAARIAVLLRVEQPQQPV